MHLKLLLSFGALAAAVTAVTAVTTGPYNIGSGHYNNATNDGSFYFIQGQAKTVVNTSIVCSASGSGLGLTSATFQLQLASFVPNRANDTSQYVGGLSSIKIGVPSSVTSYFSKAGATSIAAQNGTVLGIKYIGYRDSPIYNATGFRGSTAAQLSGAPYTILSLGQDETSSKVDTTTGLLTLVPSRRIVFKRDRLAFSLSGANKTVNFICPAGVRSEEIGAANIANLPAWPGHTAVLSVPLSDNYTPGTPPLNSTSVVSLYRPRCSFVGIGKQPFEITLGGFKSNKLISISTPAVFSLGQSNFWISPDLISFFQTKYPSTSTVSLALSAFNVSISNATPSIKNLLPSGGYAASAALGAGSFATFPSAAPSTTYPSATFTPLASSIGKGQSAVLSFDNVAGSVKLLNSNSAAIATVSFSCSEGAGNFPAVIPFQIA
ncbi:hypothetical protein CF327_g4076 [Tilletia walkeri]|nr:hypothetical protein CF327_g4076 [Tilletia walkeri]